MVDTIRAAAIPFISPDSAIHPVGLAVGLVAIFVVTLFFILPYLSELISYLGVYHRPTVEDFRVRCKKVVWVYSQLSLTLIVSYLLFLYSFNIQFEIISVLMITALTMSTLLIIRIQGNPSSDMINFKNLFPRDYRDSIVEQHRERILSFLFSLISAQLIFALIAVGFVFGQNSQFTFSFEPLTALIFVLIYLFGLGTITVVGEGYLLKIRPPINQIAALQKTSSEGQRALSGESLVNEADA